MAGKIYALLVGIDAYETAPLRGCVNDVEAWKDYLERRVAPERALELLTLTDAQASRRGIIDSFRRHLGRAESGDAALFVFSGHGSQENAAELYAPGEPEGLSQTLVAHDSRSPGGYDLAAKELAVLIAEVARNGAHVAVVLDSCHSGTATRDEAEESLVRRLTDHGPPRTLESYWFYGDESVPPELDAAGGWRVLPYGPHVLLAACEDRELAKELRWPDGGQRGAFSYYLLQALHRKWTTLSYRDLLRHAQVGVTNMVSGQHPEGEGDLGRLFLDGGFAPRPAGLHLTRFQPPGEAGEWRLDAGALRGIVPATEVAVLPREGESQPPTEPLVRGRVVDVGAGTSRVEVLDGELDPRAEVYPVALIRLPLPELSVAVESHGDDAGALIRAIEASPFLGLAQDSGRVRAVIEPGTCRIVPEHSGDEIELPLGNPAASAGEIVAALEHIARWTTVGDLTSPDSTLDGIVVLTLWEWKAPPEPGCVAPQGRPLAPVGEIVLPYRRNQSGGDDIPGRFAIHLENTGNRPIYFGIFALSPSYAVQLIRDGHGRLPAGEGLWVRRMDGIPATVPETLYRNGVHHRRDRLLLLVSEEKADFTLLEQGPILTPHRRRDLPRNEAPRSLIETLLWKVGWRELDDRPRQLSDQQWAVESRTIVAQRST